MKYDQHQFLDKQTEHRFKNIRILTNWFRPLAGP